MAEVLATVSLKSNREAARVIAGHFFIDEEQRRRIDRDVVALAREWEEVHERRQQFAEMDRAIARRGCARGCRKRRGRGGAAARRGARGEEAQHGAALAEVTTAQQRIAGPPSERRSQARVASTEAHSSARGRRWRRRRRRGKATRH